MKFILVGLCLFVFGFDAKADTESIKREIFALAESYKGQGDPDLSKQRSLEILVDQLLASNPQAPVSERLDLLSGAWQQVWGPYKYRGNDRGVDSKIDPDHIYQIVFSEGFYYNVNPTLDRNGNAKKIVLLRGEYEVDLRREDVLTAKFTDLRQIKNLPSGLRFIDLPELSEAGSLPGERTSLPSFLVRRFFKGGLLKEVYTDDELRVTFGSGSDGDVQNYIYILRRVID